MPGPRRLAPPGPGRLSPATILARSMQDFSPNVHLTASLTETVGVTDSLSVDGIFVQYDSWRPAPKPSDNSLMLVCRTPENYHDSLAGLEHLSLWTIRPDGTDEHVVLTDPSVNGHGWTRQSHPEWSPDGNSVVLLVETAGEYKLVILNSSAFGL